MSGWYDIKSSVTAMFPLASSKPAWNLVPSGNPWDTLLGYLKNGWPEDMNAGGHNLANANLTNVSGMDVGSTSGGQHQIGIYGATANKAFLGMFNDTAGIAVNRSFIAGVFTDTAKSHGEIDISGGSSGSSIAFATAAAANTIATTRLMIDKNGCFTFSTAAAPSSSPAAGSMIIYVDPADNKLKARGSSGTITALANP